MTSTTCPDCGYMHDHKAVCKCGQFSTHTLRLPNHCDPLTFAEQLDLEHQMKLITQVPDPPRAIHLSAGEWENVQRLSETLKRYRATNNPKAVERSLPDRIEINGVRWLSAFGRNALPEKPAKDNAGDQLAADLSALSRRDLIRLESAIHSEFNRRDEGRFKAATSPIRVTLDQTHEA